MTVFVFPALVCVRDGIYQKYCDGIFLTVFFFTVTVFFLMVFFYNVTAFSSRMVCEGDGILFRDGILFEGDGILFDGDGIFVER